MPLQGVWTFIVISQGQHSYPWLMVLRPFRADSFWIIMITYAVTLN